MKPTIEKGNIIEWAKTYQGDPFHALFCDAPYHLQSIVKRFGKEKSAPAKHGRDGAFSRASAGFMGQQWDGGDIAFDPETWFLLGQHLYPGAFGMAFASSRGWHRMAVAIEDAGFIIHPSIFLWAQSSGFPKATRIDSQVDRMLGKEDERNIEEIEYRSAFNSSGTHQAFKGKTHSKKVAFSSPSTEQAKAWEGHRYGLQAMKPTVEPIILFQKPYEGRPIENMMETGAGALNIDAGRIGQADWEWGTQTDITSGGYNSKRPSNGDIHKKNVKPQEGKGRWPANFVMQHHPECRIIGETEGDAYKINRFTDGAKPFGNGAGHDYESEETAGGKQYEWDCHPDCTVRRLAEQGGERKSGLLDKNHQITSEWGYHGGDRSKVTQASSYGDSGSADRFFYQADWSYEIIEQIENANAVYYCPKVSKAERNAGLDGIEKRRSNYRPNDPDESSLRTRLHNSVPRKNNHPTLKPIELNRYLTSILLPPEMYAPRRLLVPFAGVASEMLGAMMAGWEYILGIELDDKDQYIPIAKQRIDWWHNWYQLGYTDPKEILKIKSPDIPEEQLEMF